MRLVIREYLGMLRESGEFDQLVPDLLLSQGIVPLSKPQIGVRQAGVDLAAVGKDDFGTKSLWLLVLKRGDIGRSEWDSTPQSVRQSLDEAREVYLRNNVSRRHSSLPVKIVVATTGDRKQDIEQNWIGYVDTHTEKGRVDYDFWNGDEVAALVERHLLNEYLLPPEPRSDLRRALALVGEPDYNLEHFYALLGSLLRWDENEKNKSSKTTKHCVRRLVTISLALSILCKWAGTEGNLRNAVLAAERTLLWTWDAVRKHELAREPAIKRVYVRLVAVYMNVTVEYFTKLQPFFHVRDGMASYFTEAALLREQVFEQIGLVASMGLSHLFWALTNKNEEHAQGARFVSETLEALIGNNKSSGSPCYDGQVIDISLALLLFCLTGQSKLAVEWLRELIDRLFFAFRTGQWFPICTDSFDDLVQLETNRSECNLLRLKETSWIVPTIAQWAAVLHEDDAYQGLVKLCEDSLKETCLQLWYPDEKTDEALFRGPAHHESGITEAPLSIPSTAEEMRASIRKMRAESPISKDLWSSATRAGLPFLDLIASRHFRTPVDPAYWQLIDSEGKTDTGATEGISSRMRQE
jgi:hypothetical protein